MISLLFPLLLLQAEPPLVHIHAPTRIELQPPRRLENGIEISGRLVDDDNGDPIPSHLVLLTTLEEELGSSKSRNAMTDADGRFLMHFALLPGRHRVIARFDGDGTLAATRAEHTIDMGLRPLDIRVEGPAKVRRGARAKFRIFATTDGEPADVAVRVVGAPVRMRDGAAEIEIVAAGRGPQKLEASHPGDAQFNAARGEARYLVEVPVSVTLTSPQDGQTITRGQDVELVGQVRDADGPLSLVAVDIRALGQQVAVAQADAGGSFELSLPTQKLAAGHLQIEAVYRPTASWHVATHSRSIGLTLVAPSPPPLWLFALPALLAAGAALGIRTARLLRTLRARRLAPLPAPTPAPVETRGLRIVATARTLRATDLVFDGVILDARTSRPVAAAEVDSRQSTVESSEDGRFSMTLEAGRHEIVVRAEGYCDETFAITLPHRGQLRGVEARIAPIRLRVLEEFRAAAAPALGERAFDLQTPRDIAPLGGPALAELATLVEETNYSGREPSSAQVDRAHALAEEELTRSKSIHTMRPQ